MRATDRFVPIALGVEFVLIGVLFALWAMPRSGAPDPVAPTGAGSFVPAAGEAEAEMLRSDVRSLTAEIRSAHLKLAALERSCAASRAEAEALQKRLSELEKARAAAPAAPLADGGSAAVPGEQFDSAVLRVIEQDREAQRIERARRRVRQVANRMKEALTLTDPQVAAATDILMNLQLARDAVTGDGDAGFEPGSDESRRVLEEASKQAREQFVALLSAEQTQKFEANRWLGIVFGGGGRGDMRGLFRREDGASGAQQAEPQGQQGQGGQRRPRRGGGQ